MEFHTEYSSHGQTASFNLVSPRFSWIVSDFVCCWIEESTSFSTIPFPSTSDTIQESYGDIKFPSRPKYLYSVCRKLRRLPPLGRGAGEIRRETRIQSDAALTSLTWAVRGATDSCLGDRIKIPRLLIRSHVSAGRT